MGVSERDVALSYGDQAFQFVEELDRCSTPAEILDGLQKVLRPFGIDYFCFNGLVHPNVKFEDVLWACRVPADWLQHYLAEDYGSRDPSIRLCQETVHPFEYREAWKSAQCQPDAAEVLIRAEEFGVANGLLLPVPGRTGCIGNVWVGGLAPEFSKRSRPVIQLVSLFAFERIRALVGPKVKNGPALTLRETEVLTWSANGKSAWEISKILGISERTVNEHAQTATAKLGAANRTQAVAIALRDRLIRI